MRARDEGKMGQSQSTLDSRFRGNDKRKRWNDLPTLTKYGYIHIL